MIFALISLQISVFWSWSPWTSPILIGVRNYPPIIDPQPLFFRPGNGLATWSSEGTWSWETLWKGTRCAKQFLGIQSKKKTLPWNAKCPIFLGNFTPKTSNYCHKNRALGFPRGCLRQKMDGHGVNFNSGSPSNQVFVMATFQLHDASQVIWNLPIKTTRRNPKSKQTVTAIEWMTPLIITMEKGLEITCSIH